jgi:FkbM family methyltransferase
VDKIVTPTPFAFDPFRKPGTMERLLFRPKKLAALVRWRNYAGEDRAFIARIAKTGEPLSTIWDIGASNGAWSFIVGRGIPPMKHHLFEPLAGHVESYAATLVHHLADNPGWTLHPFAIGSADGSATIHADPNSYGSSLVDSEYVRQNWKQVEIAVRSGDSLIASGEAAAPDIIKADTQGFELEALKGIESNLPKVKMLLLETWLSRGYGPETPLLSELTDWLRPRGFVPVEYADSYRDADGHMRSVDAFFLREDVAKRAGFAI